MNIKPSFLDGKENPAMRRSGQNLFQSHAKLKQKDRTSMDYFKLFQAVANNLKIKNGCM